MYKLKSFIGTNHRHNESKCKNAQQTIHWKEYNGLKAEKWNLFIQNKKKKKKTTQREIIQFNNLGIL